MYLRFLTQKGFAAMNKNVFHKLSYGVYIISTWDNGRPTGCTANSAMQITSSPATVAISINHDNYTNACIKDTGRFAISILNEQTDPLIIGTFGFQSGKDVNKFDSISYEVKGYLPVVSDAGGYITVSYTHLRHLPLYCSRANCKRNDSYSQPSGNNLS